MIQIDAPCCDAILELESQAETVRCEACGLEHLLAPDARPTAAAASPERHLAAIAA